MTKSPQAFRSIGEVARLVGVATHVLRYWESQFPALSPVKRPDGRRYYRPDDVALAAGLCEVMREDGLTIRGANLLIAKDKGASLRARGRARLGLVDGAENGAQNGADEASADAAVTSAARAARRRKTARTPADGTDASTAPRPTARTPRRPPAPPSDSLPLFPDLFATEAESEPPTAPDTTAMPTAPAHRAPAPKFDAAARAKDRVQDRVPDTAAAPDHAPPATAERSTAPHRPILWLSRLTSTAAALRVRTAPMPDEARHLARALRRAHHV